VTNEKNPQRHPAIKPRGNYVLCVIEKREMTQSGLVIAATARGYDVIRVVSVGPKVEADLQPGCLIQLYPGNRTMITFDEHPEYALVEDSQIVCIDERDPAELLGKQAPSVELVQ
jgi:co-chaperonin GroES (HSP10)